jgi:S1-C subfamily serine protease
MKLIRPFLLIVLVIFAASAWAGLAQKRTSQRGSKRPAKSSKALSAKDIFARYHGAIVQIKTTSHQDGDPFQSTGSGFFYIRPDVVATALHVIQDAETIDVIDAHGAHFKVDSLVLSKDSDVALLHIVNRPKGTSIAGKQFAEVATGETIFTIGNPLGLFPDTITQGIVSGKRKLDGIPCYQMTAAISQGNSGGPVLDEHGRAIGVVDAYLTEGQSNNLAIAVNELDKIVDPKKGWVDSESFFYYSDKAGTPIRISPNATFRPVKIGEPRSLAGFVSNVALSPDGKLAAMCSDREVSLVSVEDSQTLHTEKTTKDIASTHFLSNGELLVFFVDGECQIRVCSDWTLETKFKGHDPVNLPRFSEDRQTAYYARATRSGPKAAPNWSLWSMDFKSGQSKQIMDALASEEFDISPDGQTVVSASSVWDGGPKQAQVVLWSAPTQTSKVIYEVAVKGKDQYIPLGQPTFSPDGSEFACPVAHDASHAEIRVFDAGGKLKRVLTVAVESISDLHYSSDGRKLLFLSDDWVMCVDAESGELGFIVARWMLALNESLAISNGSDFMAVASGSSMQTYALIDGTSIPGNWDVSSGDQFSGSATLGKDGTLSMTLTFPSVGGIDLKGKWEDDGQWLHITFTEANFQGEASSADQKSLLAAFKNSNGQDLPYKEAWKSSDELVLSAGKSKWNFKRHE